MDDQTAAAATKALLRAAALVRREALDRPTREALSAAIAARALPVILSAGPRHVACYHAIRGECDTAPIIAGLRAAGVEVGLPAVLDPTTIAFRHHHPDKPVGAGGFGTLAPLDDAPLLEPDLIVVPLVAFDRRGARLGYGKGFYDRAFAALAAAGLRPLRLGIAFAIQEVETIPVEAHDFRLDVVVTERETLDLRQAAD